ncbi:glutamate receptor [Aplysia californica]|uniref:Glutamate receptor n=1 Tax=Aplysia californica TaxID=6500 RepID=A0ABM0JD28_APLCA|nr:glutamate receptor [Aplysia californica]
MAKSNSSLPFLEVVVKEDPPFVFSSTDSSGKVSLSGLSIDLLERVANLAGFTYNVSLTNHASYGHKINGKWTGLISELESNAQIAIGPFTDSPSYAELSKPFMNSGVNFVIKNPQPSGQPQMKRDIGLLLEPFAAEVWVMILLAFVAVSLALFLIGRFSPYEWARVAKEKDVRHARTSFGLKNSFLFAASTLGWQGYREAPKSTSGRILMCMWFFFTVFVLLSYTACLCSILTIRSHNSVQPVEDKRYVPFKDAADILDKKNVKVGAMKYSYVYKTLQDSKSSGDLSKLFNYIENSQDWIQNENEGIQRVKDSGGKYALLIGSVKADYIESRHCDLVTYGGLTDKYFRYTFAISSRSLLTTKINWALLRLKEDGQLHMMQMEYFIKGQKCPANDKSKLVPVSEKSAVPFASTYSRLDMRDMAIAFLFLFLGVLAAGAALGAEIFYRRWLLSKRDPDKKVREPLNTESGISRAPKATPPPPPIYKVNKLQENDKNKKEENVAKVAQSSDVEKGNDIELEVVEDKPYAAKVELESTDEINDAGTKPELPSVDTTAGVKENV